MHLSHLIIGPTDVCALGRAHLEASAERWSRLLGLLEELWRWICLKDEDLAKQMPIGGDVPTLLQQQNYCTVCVLSQPMFLPHLRKYTFNENFKISKMFKFSHVCFILGILRCSCKA